MVIKKKEEKERETNRERGQLGKKLILDKSFGTTYHFN